MTSSTIFVVGDVKGNLDGLLKHLEKMSKKVASIDYVFCVGDFFGANHSAIKNAVEGKLKVPYPLYIAAQVPEEALSLLSNVNGCELCTNLIYLGKQGVFHDATGLQVVYFTGSENAVVSGRDVHDLLAQCNAQDNDFLGVDFLLTVDWPAGVTNYLPSHVLSNANVLSAVEGSKMISKLAEMLRPRYHFAAKENLYFQRPPYRNHRVLQERSRHVTRFFGLAEFDNKNNEKFISAVQVTPMMKMERTALLQAPDYVSECPYVAMESIPASSASKAPQKRSQIGDNQYFYAQPEQKLEKPNFRKKPRMTVTPDQCWFCLGNIQCERHLVLSVGEACYLALAKGPLQSQHVLIVPVSHHASSVVCPFDVLQEIEAYKRALKQCFHEKLDCDLLTFERNFRSQHLQLQALAVPRGSVEMCKTLFVEEAHSLCGGSLQLEEIPRATVLSEIVDAKKPYFHVSLDDGSQLFGTIEGSKEAPFPLQFGRSVLAHENLLNVPGKVNWQDVSLTKDQETTLCNDFRKLFATYDIQ